MKKVAALLIIIALILPFGVFTVFAEDSRCTITLHYLFPGYEDETVLTESGTKIDKALRNNVFQNVSRTPYGYDFSTWYYDEGLTLPIDKKDLVEKDTELYAEWIAWDQDRKELIDSWSDEMDLCKELLNYMPMYTPESFWPYHDTLYMAWNGVRKASPERIEELRQLRQSLVQVHDRDEVIWDIWGDEIPQEDTSDYDFWLLQDSREFRPHLAAFLLEDQSTVKGNIIAVSGGAFTQRSNDCGAYPTAEHMNALGYNCFVLQYRIKPYETIDSYLDLQRAIRYLKYHAEEKNIGAIDRIATIGYSAGGMVVIGQIAYCYGDTLPTEYYPDYTLDEIDLISSDVTAAAPVYGPSSAEANAVLCERKENIPPMFMAVGTKDSLCRSVVEDFLVFNELTECELHVYDGVPHSFGMTDMYEGADQIDEQFDAFLKVHFGISNRMR